MGELKPTFPDVASWVATLLSHHDRGQLSMANKTPLFLKTVKHVAELYGTLRTLEFGQDKGCPRVKIGCVIVILELVNTVKKSCP